jgi:hypothetical protein
VTHLPDDVRELAELVAAAPDDVADLGAEIAAWYRRQRQEALDRVGIAAFLSGADVIDENHPSLAGLRVQLRDRLRNLLAWARDSGRM